MTILLLGHTGKIGSFLFDNLVRTEDIVVTLGRSKNKSDIYYDFDKKKGELYKLENLKVDLVINALGKLPKHKAAQLEYSNANIDALEILQKYLNRETKIVQLSTISVYGEEVINRAVKESDEIKPKNNYAITKLQAEEFIIKNFKNYWIFRIPPVYENLNDKILHKRIILNKIVEIIFDGDQQKHSYCALSRIYQVISTGCIETILPFGIYNLADKNYLSIKEIKSRHNTHSLFKIPVSSAVFLKSRDLFRFLKIYSISEKINEIYYKTCTSNLYGTDKLEKYI
jgi:nucleoside-diphosphate-sugar epimerase